MTHWPHEKTERNLAMVAAWNSGATYAELSEQFGVGKGVIYRILAKYGGRRRRGIWVHRPEEHRTYTKVRNALGAKDARKAWGIIV